jgi:hypothetical protein
VNHLLLPHARRVASPSWVLDRRAVAGCAGQGRPDKHRPRAAHTGPAPRGREPCSRVAVGRVCAVHVGRADAVSVGHAPLCNWAEREFGPVTLI